MPDYKLGACLSSPFPDRLCRLHEGGIMCPRVVTLRKHILIMEFIGEDQKPAPKLKDLTGGQLGRDQMNSAYQQCIQVRERGGREGWRERGRGGGRGRGDREGGREPTNLL